MWGKLCRGLMQFQILTCKMMSSHQLLSSRNLSSLILNGIVGFIKIDTWISLSCYRDLSKSYTDFPREGVKNGYFTVRLAVRGHRMLKWQILVLRWCFWNGSIKNGNKNIFRILIRNPLIEGVTTNKIYLFCCCFGCFCF